MKKVKVKIGARDMQGEPRNVWNQSMNKFEGQTFEVTDERTKEGYIYIKDSVGRFYFLPPYTFEEIKFKYGTKLNAQ